MGVVVERWGRDEVREKKNCTKKKILVSRYRFSQTSDFTVDGDRTGRIKTYLDSDKNTENPKLSG